MAGSLTVLLLNVLVLLVVAHESQVDVGYQSDLVSDSSISALFDKWCAEHGKVYETAERLARLEIFKERLLQIDAHNQDGKQLYKQGLNQFSDMSSEERRAAFPQIKVSDMLRHAPPSKKKEKASQPAALELPASVDWRNKGAVSRVKDVGQCTGATWAYAAVGAVEGSLKVNNYTLVELSAQQLMDCDTDPYNRKCISGNVPRTFDLILESGIVKEKAYLFTGSDTTCKTPATDDWYIITGSEERVHDLKGAVAKQPIVIAVDGSSDDFLNYKSGIFTGKCDSSKVSQWLLVVGYNTDSTSRTDYWLLKNSWGFAWGENGYMRMKQGICGDSNFASYPTGAAPASRSVPCSRGQGCPQGMTCCCRDPAIVPVKKVHTCGCKSYMCCPNKYACKGGCCSTSKSVQQEETVFVAGNQTVASY